MAGSYPDVPGRRMAYHADGTVVLHMGNEVEPPGGPWIELTPTQKAALNSEEPAGLGTPLSSGADAGRPHSFTGFIFPELRELDGWFGGIFGGFVSSTARLETSADTTNGIDGTWTSRSTSTDLWDPTGALEDYREEIVSFNVSAIRAVRVRGDAAANNPDVYVGHLYGEITPGQTPDRLLWIDEVTGLEFTADLDYGDVPRGGSEDRELRLANNSATLDADNVQYTTSDLYRGAAGWFTFTLPGGVTFQSTQQVAAIPATETTDIITVRRITPATALGLYAAYFGVSVESWI